MARYLVINKAPDGRHLSLYYSLPKAQKRVHDMVGGPEREFKVNQPYYSDWGNTLYIEERPDTWTLLVETKVGKAYDARECGTATQAQLEMLEKLGW
jgi:hypothetical protein